MAISVSLVGGQTPRLIQIVVSATAVGVAWQVTGSAGGVKWTVPGGAGIGDGNALVLVDNRSPLNTPIVYTYTPATGSPQVASAVTAASASAMVLQSLDGQESVAVDLLTESGDIDLSVQQAVFDIPGRERPVVRYSVTGDGGGSFRVGMDRSLTADFRSLMRSGAPILVRRQEMLDDLPLVMVALFTSVGSRQSNNVEYRTWTLPYLLVDDPYLDVRLGAFAWDSGFDAELAGRSWTTFDTNMSGRTWAQFDTVDWTTV